MKILLYSMNFSPEMAGIGKYSGEMADWLKKKGHDVRVIAAPPYFPQWKPFIGYNAWSYTATAWNGIPVWRAPTWIPARPGGLTRILHLATFMFSSMPLLALNLRWKPDVVMVVEPPLFCAPAVLAFSKLLRIKSWLHIQDYELDAAFELGLMRGNRSRRMAESAERWLLNKFSRVSTISSQMVERARDKGTANSRLVLFPNWVDVSSIYPLAGRNAYRDTLLIPQDAVVVLYSGSMGRKQGLDVLSTVARQLNTDRNIHFVFCGNGPTRDELARQCEDLPNVHFMDLQPIDRLNELLGLADIHVLPQRADAADLVMPSKLTGMLASGRAVIVTAQPDTELGRVGKQCAHVVAPGDAPALAEAISLLSKSRAQRDLLGASGRAYAENELNRNAILQRFEQEMLRCVAE